MNNNNNEKLISFDEIIILAKKMGVDFGNGDVRQRLRYYTKMGLLPHAQRKCFNNNSPQGAYPESVIDLLVDIDKKIKSGKSIQKIKREIEEEREKREKTKERLFEVSFAPSLPRDIYNTYPPEISETREEFVFEEKPELPSKHLKLNFFLKALLILLIFGSIVFFVKAKPNIKNLIAYFPAALNKGDELRSSSSRANAWIFEKLSQAPSSLPLQEKTPATAIVEPYYEPYLTINAETAINGPLKVKEQITAPLLSLTKGEFGGRLTVADLTASRNYIFPDQSGTICLTTGNCIELGGELTGAGGVSNRLARFISAGQVGNASISDFYNLGVAVTIDANGRVGIGTGTPKAKLEVAGDLITTGSIGIGIEGPAYPLHVQGRIQATGDICTNLAGGRCLSTLPVGGGGWVTVAAAGAAGIGGSGSTNYLPIWTGSTALGNSIASQSGNVLDIAGTVKMTGFQLATGATSSYVLTSDVSGVGTWQVLPEGTLPSGTSGYTLRHNGTNWIANSFLYNTGSAIGIGTTSTTAVLTVSGDGYFSGPLTLATSTVPQLVLEYDSTNYLRFSINSTSTEILASKSMILNSLTGEIGLGNNVTLLNATSATVWGQTFVSSADDATVRKRDELILRSSVPVFKFPVPAQTTSTVAVAVTRQIATSTLNAALPSSLTGTTRQFAFLLNFADDISTSASSTWIIDLTAGSDTEFYFAGQQLPLGELEEGVAHMSGLFSLPEENWQLTVSVPAGNIIRVFNIFLLVFDKVN
jgi:DNA-binding transcriptional MerR regulator